MTEEERAFNYASTRKASKFQVGEIAKYYNNGYHQAEKDLELTWEDIQNIRFIIAEMMKECFTENISWNTHEEFSKEVLKRFNNQRKK